MAYRGKFKPKNINKYRGDPTKVVYRSLWERQVFRYLDTHSNVEWWQSEELVIPYRYAVDNKVHRYFVDIVVKFNNRPKPLVIEIKPKKETTPPKLPASGRKTKRYINEALTYQKNIDKWAAAEKYCTINNMEFMIWHEDVIKGLGIKLLT